MAYGKIWKSAAVAAMLIVPSAQAFAYSIHVKNGEYKIECDNGVTSSGSTLQISHAEAEHFCKVRNSSMATGNSGGTPTTGAKVDAAKERVAMPKGK